MSHLLACARCTALALGTTLVVLGCASPPGGGTVRYTATEPSRPDTQGVAVSVDASSLSGDRLAAFLAHGGSARIADAVVSKLQLSGLSRPEALEIEVTGFRLRSSSSAFWLGFTAGADTVAVSVQVVDGGEVKRTFSTNTSTAVGGLIRPGSVNRFNRMVNTLADRIVAGI